MNKVEGNFENFFTEINRIKPNQFNPKKKFCSIHCIMRIINPNPIYEYYLVKEN